MPSMGRKKKTPEDVAEREQDQQIDKQLREEATCRLTLFARLASIDSLEALSKSVKQALIQEVKRAGMGFSVPDAYIRPRHNDPRAAVAWGDGSPPWSWYVLWTVYPWARQLINDLLDHRETVVPALPARKLELIRMVGEDFTTRVTDTSVEGGGLDFLLASLRQYPFPYRRCPQCRNVFVRQAGRGRPKKFCTWGCQVAAHDAAQRGVRNEYLRVYMRQYRERTHAQVRREASAVVC